MIPFVAEGDCQCPNNDEAHCEDNERQSERATCLSLIAGNDTSVGHERDDMYVLIYVVVCSRPEIWFVYPPPIGSIHTAGRPQRRSLRRHRRVCRALPGRVRTVWHRTNGKRECGAPPPVCLVRKRCNFKRDRAFALAPTTLHLPTRHEAFAPALLLCML